jgi:hypothetical protein
VYKYQGRILYNTVLNGFDFHYTDNGTTCVPEHLAKQIKLRPDPDFNAGYIFEKNIVAGKGK